MKSNLKTTHKTQGPYQFYPKFCLEKLQQTDYTNDIISTQRALSFPPSIGDSEPQTRDKRVAVDFVQAVTVYIHNLIQLQ